ncbi:hypothetical protein AALD22_09050 [Lachnospiraceae bacterium 56-18]|jgi:hypothetical protein
MWIGWYILFRIGEIIGICRLIYFFAVERNRDMKREMNDKSSGNAST